MALAGKEKGLRQAEALVSLVTRLLLAGVVLVAIDGARRAVLLAVDLGLVCLGKFAAVGGLHAGFLAVDVSFAALEPEIVKLDMTLVRNVHKQSTKQKLIRSMTALCKDMGMMVVGEGVENVEERDALVELGCDLLQGYLFAKPGAPFPPYSWGP